MTLTKTPLHTLWTGAFGERVATHISALTGSASTAARHDGTYSATWPHARLRIVATWRHEPVLTSRLSELHTAFGTPWLPVVLEYPKIRIGPLIVPGEGPCHDCYLARRSQHDRSPVGTAALRASAAADPEAGVSGFTEGQAMVAAGLAVDLVQARGGEPHAVAPGRVLFYDVLSRALITDTVLGVHGCPRCGTSTHPDEGWIDLATHLRLGEGVLTGGLR
ncbi:TOMM precursor leader peptide-binding protein [Streptomyces sp. NPDC056401]|uniref:TOMM precursor leader peptide-binding protein n=1 Tax=Streptomyces sp. NPDC056401 TaxID=3345809 RepID=UPI0035D61053